MTVKLHNTSVRGLSVRLNAKWRVAAAGLRQGATTDALCYIGPNKAVDVTELLQLNDEDAQAVCLRSPDVKKFCRRRLLRVLQLP